MAETKTATAKKTPAKKTPAKAPAKKKVNKWTEAELRKQIKEWKKELSTPINQEEIDWYKTHKPNAFITPKFKAPTKPSFYKYVSRNITSKWTNGTPEQQKLHEIYADEVLAYIEDYMTQLAVAGKVGGMFYLKTSFGYSEYGKKKDENPVIVNINLENKGKNKL